MNKLYLLCISLICGTAYGEDYNYKSLEAIYVGNSFEGPDFRVNEIVISAGGKTIYVNGIGASLDESNVNQNIKCIISGVLNFCLPTEFNGKHERWIVGDLRFDNQGQVQSGFKDKSYFYLIKVFNLQTSKYVGSFYYSMNRGVIGMTLTDFEEGNAPQIYWVDGYDGFKFSTFNN